MPRLTGVIKADSMQQQRLPMMSLRSFHMNDVMIEARALVSQAKVDAASVMRGAENLFHDATKRAQQLEQESAIRGEKRGYQAGYDKGLAEGREAGRKEAYEAASHEFEEKQASLVESCKAIISAIHADREAWQTTARQDMVELAMAIARRVACAVGREHREVVLANLEEAVRLVGARTDVTIAVNPADSDAARAFAKSLIDMREQWQKVRVVDEAEIAPGGCRVQWGSGSIDATLETQLDRIEVELNAGRMADRTKKKTGEKNLNEKNSDELPLDRVEIELNASRTADRAKKNNKSKKSLGETQLDCVETELNTGQAKNKKDSNKTNSNEKKSNEKKSSASQSSRTKAETKAELNPDRAKKSGKNEKNKKNKKNEKSSGESPRRTKK